MQDLKQKPLNEDQALVIFARAPILGTVKTRLARHLDPGRVLGIYRGFVEHTVATARQAGFPLFVFFCPDNQGALMEQWLGPDLVYASQAGQDLGSRMADAFFRVFSRGYKQVVLMGTDVPEIKQRHIAEAFGHLEQVDCVLGPTLDGGYWLIGFNSASFDDAMFKGMEWGSSEVYETTLKQAGTCCLTVKSLAPVRDIDTIEDLHCLDGSAGAIRIL